MEHYRPIFRPNLYQKIVYNGHKRVHGLKYQYLAPPNGMIANMYVLIGNFIIEVINLFGWILKFHPNHKLEYHLFRPHFRGQNTWFSHDGRFWSSWWTRATCVLNNKRTIYGDPAYPLRVHLQVPYRVAGITPQMELYNKAMSSVCMCVEWLFRDIVNCFKF